MTEPESDNEPANSFDEKGSHTLPAHCSDIALGEDSGGDVRVFAACIDGGVYAIDPASGDHEEVARHGSFASGVHVVPGTGEVISAGYDGMITWTEPGTWQRKRVVDAHEFWSWQSALSDDGSFLASVTGQYRCGGYRYEPAPETEPSVKVFDAGSGELVQAFPHLPPVESVGFSRDGTMVAAGNLMGDVRVWEVASGREILRFNTPSFTGWGIIKGHYFTGGVFSTVFSPGGESLYLAGMGSTRDPAAGNGKQLWERFALAGEKAGTVEGSAADDEIGQGLMESLSFHPDGGLFVMAGRLFKGDWNAAAFNAGSGERVASWKTGTRVSKAVFSQDGSTLYLAGGKSQKREGDAGFKPFGNLKVYAVRLA